MSKFRRALQIWLLLLVQHAHGAGLTYVVTGVDEPMRTNVYRHLETLATGLPAMNPEPQQIAAKIESAVREALRPYGYYHPNVSSQLRERRGLQRSVEHLLNQLRADEDAKSVVEVQVNIGPPVTVGDARIAVAGEGAGLSELGDWRRKWPLTKHSVLNQLTWEKEKKQALEIAQAHGYLGANLSEHTINLDLQTNTAVLQLTVDTGPRYVFGTIDFGDYALKPGILEYIPRFEPGDPYDAQLLDSFRADLWKTGYFSDVEVVETRHPDQQPPVVDLEARLVSDKKNTYQGSLGFGTDTGARLQAQWIRQPVSRKGDRIDIGIGYQQQNDQIALRGSYRLPRLGHAREYWTVDATLNQENQDLEFKRDEQDVDFIKLANGDILDRHLRLGHLKVRNSDSGIQQLFRTFFVQYLNSTREFRPFSEFPQLQDLSATSAAGRLFRGNDNALSVGVDLDLVAIHGKQFNTVGHHERAWVFAANSNLGSDITFAQFYLSSRQSYLFKQRWKLILRAEVGYTNAPVDQFSIDVAGVPLDLSVTRLPNFYRFKAGGGNSVRGYGFEQLSNNDVGSNNIVTASAEIEFRFLPTWSFAAFYDIGNAFSDWSDPQLKAGVGVGVRWYSIAGPIRVDVARALDFEGKPWRLDFSIGTPLL